jgi:hypothetical protein
MAARLSSSQAAILRFWRKRVLALPVVSRRSLLSTIFQAKNNVSAGERMRRLGVCTKTVWLVKHKLLEVMTEREADRVLAGRVEIDGSGRSQ